MTGIARSLQFAAWLFAIGSWLLILVEWVGWLAFLPWVFRIGFKMAAETDFAPGPIGLSVPGPGETENTKYLVLADGRCLFRRKYRYFDIRWNTPLDTKGVIAWQAGQVTTTGRFMLGPILFMSAWLIGWSTGAARVDGVEWVLVGLAFVLVIVVPSYFIEVRRFRGYASEVLAALGQPQQRGVA